jgi:hypothetical protein
MAQNESRPSVEPAGSMDQDQDVDLDDIFGEHVMSNVNSVPAGSIADALTGLDNSLSLVDYPQPFIGEHVTSAAMLSGAPIGTSGSWAIETIIPRENVMYMVTMFFEFVSYSLSLLYHGQLSGISAATDCRPVSFHLSTVCSKRQARHHVSFALVEYSGCIVNTCT